MRRLGVVVAALAFASMGGSAFAAPAPPAWVGCAGGNPSSGCASGTSNTAFSGVTNVAVASSGGHTYAYTVGYWSGQLNVVDITNPASPQLMGSTTSTTSMVAATNIMISGNFAYVTAKNRNLSCLPGPPPNCGSGSNDDGSGNALTIVNISNPSSPTVVGSLQDPAHLFGAYADEVVSIGGSPYAVVASQGLLGGQPTTPDTSHGSLSIIDVSNPAAPAIAGSGAATIDNSALTGPVLTNGLDHATGVAVYSSGVKTYAYVTAFYGHKLTVFDISNPTVAPVPVTSVSDPINLGFPNDVVIQGHYAYVANQTANPAPPPTYPQLSVYDLSNPASPQLVGTLANPGLNGAYRIRILNNIAYIAASGAQAVAMVDISDPTAPAYLGEVVATTHLNHTTGVDVGTTPSGVIAVGVQPLLPSESNPTYPPYPLQMGGSTNTGVLTTVQVDPVPLTASFSSAPSGPTAVTSASFAFSLSDQVATVVQCQLDGGTLSPCGGGTAQFSNLSGGSHTFTVQANDATGNTVSTNYTWTVTPPVNTAAPTVTGVISPGSTLTGGNGTWTGSPTFTYQWLLCNSSGCTPLQGATSTTLTVHKSYGGYGFEFQVTAATSAGQTVATSPETPALPGGGGGGGSGVPAVQVGPAISGQAVQGATLTVSTGTWSGSPKLSVSWQRCDASGQKCTAIAGQTANTYTLAAADVGTHVRAVVNASNSAGSANASTPLTGAVAWSSVSGIRAKLGGSKTARPHLAVTVPSLGGGIVLQKLTLSLPKGLKFASLKTLKRLVSLGTGAQFTAKLSHGVLTLTLTHPAAGVVLSLKQGSLKLKRLGSTGATLTLTLFYSGLPARHVVVAASLK